MTMTLVSTVTVGSGGAASITFGSIPQTGTDIYILLSGRSLGSAAFKIQFNSSSTGFTNRYLSGNGSSAGSYTDTTGYVGALAASTYTTSTFGNASFYIPNYSGSTNKSFSGDVVSENNTTLSYADITAGIWANTAAITSVTFTQSSGFAQYSTASLYLITKGSGGATVS